MIDLIDGIDTYRDETLKLNVKFKDEELDLSIVNPINQCTYNIVQGFRSSPSDCICDENSAIYLVDSKLDAIYEPQIWGVKGTYILKQALVQNKLFIPLVLSNWNKVMYFDDRIILRGYCVSCSITGFQALDNVGEKYDLKIEEASGGFNILIPEDVVYPLVIDPSYVVGNSSAGINKTGRRVVKAVSGRLWYTYIDSANSYVLKLKYSDDDGQNWAEKPIGTYQNCQSSTVAVDSQNIVWVHFVQDVTQGLEMAWLPRLLKVPVSGSSVVYEVEDFVNGYSAEAVSVAIDSTDRVHLVWSLDTNIVIYTIKYRTFKDGIFTAIEHVSSATEFDQSENPDIAIDSSGHVHVVWAAQGNNTPGGFSIAYRKRDSVAWHPVEFLTDTPNNGNFFFPSIVLKNDKPYVSYRGPSDYDYNPPNSNPYAISLSKRDSIGSGVNNKRFLSKWSAVDPGHIARDRWGNIYVLRNIGSTTGSNHKIYKYDSQGNYITEWLFGTPIWNLRAICVDRNDQVYVAARTASPSGGRNQAIKVFDKNGNFLRQVLYSDTANMSSGALVADPDEDAIYYGWMKDVGNPGAYVRKMNSQTFAQIWQAGGAGNTNGKFNGIRGIAISKEGGIKYLYVADSADHGGLNSNNRIQKLLASNGLYVTKWGSSGSGNGQFNRPYGVAVYTDNNEQTYVYVCDRYNHRVQKFTTVGGYIDKWGSSGTGDGQFNEPFGLTIGNSGRVYVADFNNDRMQMFGTGNFIYWNEFENSLGADGFYSPKWITVLDNASYSTYAPSSIMVVDTQKVRIVGEIFSNKIYFNEYNDIGGKGTQTQLLDGAKEPSLMVDTLDEGVWGLAYDNISNQARFYNSKEVEVEEIRYEEIDVLVYGDFNKAHQDIDEIYSSSLTGVEREVIDDFSTHSLDLDRLVLDDFYTFEVSIVSREIIDDFSSFNESVAEFYNLGDDIFGSTLAVFDTIDVFDFNAEDYLNSKTTLSFTFPLPNTGLSVRRMVILRKDNGYPIAWDDGNATVIADTTATEGLYGKHYSVDDLNLTNREDYYYTVFLQGGDDIWSSPTDYNSDIAYPLDVPPDIVQDLRVEYDLNVGAFRVNWTNPPDDDTRHVVVCFELDSIAGGFPKNRFAGLIIYSKTDVNMPGSAGETLLYRTLADGDYRFVVFNADINDNWNDGTFDVLVPGNYGAVEGQNAVLYSVQLPKEILDIERLLSFVAVDGMDSQSRLEWVFPEAEYVTYVEIRRSIESVPQLLTDGELIGNFKRDLYSSYIDLPLTNGVQYYYSAFTNDGEGNYEEYMVREQSNKGILWDDAIPLVEIVPNSVTGFEAQDYQGDRSYLTWVNSIDDVVLLRIVANESDYPRDEIDGTAVYEIANPVPGQAGVYLHEGLSGDAVFYTAFVKSQQGVWDSTQVGINADVAVLLTMVSDLVASDNFLNQVVLEWTLPGTIICDVFVRASVNSFVNRNDSEVQAKSFTLPGTAIKFIHSIENDEDFLANQQYYYSIFLRKRVGVDCVWVDNLKENVNADIGNSRDVLNMIKLSGFFANPGNGYVELRWLLSNLIENIQNRFMIRKSIIGYPTSINEGSLVYEEEVENSSGKINDSDVSNGTTYYYSAFVGEEMGH